PLVTGVQTCALPIFPEIAGRHLQEHPRTVVGRPPVRLPQLPDRAPPLSADGSQPPAPIERDREGILRRERRPVPRDLVPRLLRRAPPVPARGGRSAAVGGERGGLTAGRGRGGARRPAHQGSRATRLRPRRSREASRSARRTTTG